MSKEPEMTTIMYSSSRNMMNIFVSTGDKLEALMDLRYVELFYGSQGEVRLSVEFFDSSKVGICSMVDRNIEFIGFTPILLEGLKRVNNFCHISWEQEFSTPKGMILFKETYSIEIKRPDFILMR